MTDSELLARVAVIGGELTALRVAELAATVSKCESAADLEARANALATLTMQKMAHQLADAWSGVACSADALAIALRVAQIAAQDERENETVALTWTGPKSTKVAVLRNDQALFEIIDGASVELLVVSAFTWNMPAVVEKLASAVDRGVTVKLVLEYHDKKGEPTGFDPAKDLGGNLRPEIGVFEWPRDMREIDPTTGSMGYLHVKCAVADRQHAFVSSANLTVYAMQSNMELGVVVRGGDVPGRIAAHFEALMDSGILQQKGV